MTYKTTPLSFIVIGLMSLFFLSSTACSDGNTVTEKQFFNNCWHITDSLTFEIAHEGEGQTTQGITPKLQFLDEYPYRNIFLKCIVQSPSGQLLDTLIGDTLIDPIGNWIGDSLSRSLPTLQIPLEEQGTYTCKVTQYMRDENLCQIRQASIALISSK